MAEAKVFHTKQVPNLPPLQMHGTCPYNSQTNPILWQACSWLPVAVGLVSFSGIHNSRGCQYHVNLLFLTACVLITNEIIYRQVLSFSMISFKIFHNLHFPDSHSVTSLGHLSVFLTIVGMTMLPTNKDNLAYTSNKTLTQRHKIISVTQWSLSLVPIKTPNHIWSRLYKRFARKLKQWHILYTQLLLNTGNQTMILRPKYLSKAFHILQHVIYMYCKRDAMICFTSINC